jgi:hypothetical protein
MPNGCGDMMVTLKVSILCIQSNTLYNVVHFVDVLAQISFGITGSN